MLSFLRSVIGEGENHRVSFEDAYINLLLALKAEESARAGGVPIEINYD